MMRIQKIGVFVFFMIMVINIVTAIGPAPIIVKGFTNTDKLDSVKIEIVNDKKEIVEQKNNFDIIKINDTLYHYLVTITIKDTLKTNYMDIEFLYEQEVVFKIENLEVIAWENIELNFTGIGEKEIKEKNTDLKIGRDVQRPNTISNELKIQNYEHQLSIENESFIFEFYNITEETLIDKITNNLIYPIKSTIEMPARFSLHKINESKNYMIVVVLITIIMLQFTSLILHRRKKN
jgi:hypothetical protein